MKRFAVAMAMLLVVAACGDDDGGLTTVAPDGSTSSTVAVSAAPSSTTTASTTSAAPTSTGPTDCSEIWPETAVQAVAGESFAFFAANDDQSACTFTALPNGIALAWRTSDRAGFDESKRGAGLTGLPVNDVPLCDAGFFTEIQGSVLIMEGYSATQGRAYNATISGVGLSNALEWGTALIGAACG